MPITRKLSDTGEWGLLEKLKRFYPVNDARLIVGFGDDAAVIDFSSQSDFYLLATVDTLVEGTHFLSSCYDPILLGKKAVTVNLSDIAAIGGIPEFMLVSLAAPPDFPVPILNTIYQGMLAVAKEHNVILVNGDTVRSPRLTLSICLLGKKPKQEHLPLRSAARPEQYVYVTGTLGESGLGVHLLKTKRKSQLTALERSFVRRHYEPTARVREGRWLTVTFSDLALIDISDGLFNELNLLKKFSSVGFDINLTRIPISPPLHHYCQRQGLDALHFALFGGEDYELLFTTATTPQKMQSLFSTHFPSVPVSCIGTTISAKKIKFRNLTGKTIRLSDHTFRHFN